MLEYYVLAFFLLASILCAANARLRENDEKENMTLVVSSWLMLSQCFAILSVWISWSFTVIPAYQFLVQALPPAGKIAFLREFVAALITFVSTCGFIIFIGASTNFAMDIWLRFYDWMSTRGSLSIVSSPSRVQREAIGKQCLCEQPSRG